jgi:hypothetical protein
MKMAMTAVLAGLFAYSVYGTAKESMKLAIFFVVVMIATLVWRTLKGWPDWWAKL